MPVGRQVLCTVRHFLTAPHLRSLESAKEHMLYSYNQAMSGFSAKLTPDQVESLKGNRFFRFHGNIDFMFAKFSHISRS